MLEAGRYRLVELLGRGAMGEVWRAQDAALGRDVAVKLLLEHTAAPDAAERFRREAQTVARLNHPNVVAAYDFGEEDGRGYLVMELVPGRSLRNELAERGPLDVEQARRLAGQAATGLAAAHVHGVVHRDVKPGNLLLTADGTVKVADFGIARAATEATAALTSAGELLGTTAYLAPERMSDEAAPPSDVYALGCVLYEMLCGRPPFTGEPAAIVYRHVHVAPQPLTAVCPGIPAALADLVHQMLAKEPAARPTAAQVADVLTGEPPAPSGPREAGGVTQQEAETSRSTVPLPTATAATATATKQGDRARRSALPGVAALVAIFLAACLVGFQLDSPADKSERKPSPAETQSPRQESPSVREPSPDKGRHQHDGPGREGPEEKRKRREEAIAKEAEKPHKGAEEKREQQEDAAKKKAEKPRKP